MKRTKKFLAFVIAFAIVISSSFTLLSNIVYAEPIDDNNDVYGTIEFMADDKDTVSGNTITYSNGYKLSMESEDSITLTKDTSNGRYAINEIKNSIVITFILTIPEGQNTVPDLMIAGAREFFDSDNECQIRFDFNSERNFYAVELDFGNVQGGNNGPVGGSEDIDFDIEFTNTHVNVWINNKVVISDENGEFINEYQGTIEEAGTVASDSTNVLRFLELFGEKPVNEFTINGVTYKEGMDEVRIEDNGVSIIVPGAEKYVIRGEGDSNVETPKTIIWTNPGYVPKDEADAEWIKEFSLENGSAYIKAIYDEEGNLVDNDFGTGVGENNFGWITVTPGNKVVFEFVPKYGYQLTEVLANGFALEPQETINQYIFTMPDTNIHFDAEFTKTEDIVKANSEKVSSGTVALGEGDKTLDAGTVQLTVSDVSLSSNKIAGFEETAGEYTISEYLDIDLYQVFYKGKNDSNDVWTNKISELEKEATITIKLEEGINADDIVIVHNIHDGDEYEVIKIESYDAETNTITFKTSSFSNYAIAIKTTATDVKEPEKTTTELEKPVEEVKDTKSEMTKAAEEEASKLLEAYMKDGTIKGATKELFDKIIAADEAGKDISLEVSIPAIDEKNVPSEDVKKVAEKMPKGAKIAAYYDINLLIKIEGEEVGKITELNNGITITVPIPTDLPKVEDGYTREYTIIRVHEGIAEELKATVKDGNVSFKTDKFSTYALGYKDVKNETNPKTGDSIIIMSTIFAIAVIGSGVVSTMKKARVNRH